MASVLQIQTVNECISLDPQRLIAEENARYVRSVRKTAEQLFERFHNRCLVLLSGPSASGKTTTALNLQRALRERGREAHTVSLDNFYLGRGKAPRLPDGSFDYETVEALDLPLLRRCMAQLLEEGCAQLPIFDFHDGKRCSQTQPLTIGEESIVIFEGIHALNPLLEEHLPGDNRFKLFINVDTAVYDGEREVLSKRDIRLARRTLRDVRFRNSSIENTMDMWRQVVRGEDLYLFPYVDTADVVFDTAHAYEPAVLGSELLPLLRQVSVHSPHHKSVCRLINGLSGFEPLCASRLPSDCLLREFVG